METLSVLAQVPLFPAGVPGFDSQLWMRLLVSRQYGPWEAAGDGPNDWFSITQVTVLD